MALILDVARFKYPPHWVPLTLLWEAMNNIDETTGKNKGFIFKLRSHPESGLLYSLKCGESRMVGESLSQEEKLKIVVKVSVPRGRDFGRKVQFFRTLL
ncbi:glutathione gamma-glutamylcysteinyltransferase 1-like isoform X2 [Hevea brasiliensis]|uniref:glutathione gamma-glutamylcysteinyltransferase 1-like isoform X2 n=1 Tax=Hevea brasiliensis TaxID=3981 RepID=UPI0025E54C03|nr:glutathione gamma-glutamylcysteinyltransferase 1-like isoform X2 [Hevea brasiliensis]